MWKDYSIGFIKKNRASSVSVLVAAFISALFLSLLCGLFYNFWNYEIESVVLEEGNWQGRISGAFEEDKVSEIENFANVKTAIINEDLSDDQTLVVDICFDNMRAVYQDMPLIAQQLGVPETSVSYHESLLSSYFINDPQDSNPPLLMAFYLFVLLLVSVSLILIIHNSFAVSMNARVHQFGIFSSIGATPGQIRTCLLQEAAMLCVIPVLIGSFVGIALTFGAIQAVNILADGIVGRHEAAFAYHPLVFAVTILTSFLTVLISAWLPARKLSKMTPLEAIKNTGECTGHEKVINVCIREDCESEQENIDDFYEKIKQNYNIRKVSTVIKSPVVLRKRIGELQKSWETFANAEITITDRLHAMLFSVLNGTPCIVLNNKTGKVFGVADWLDDTNMIVRANSLSEVLEKLKRTTIWEHKKYDREKLLNYFEKMAEVIRKD